MTDDIRRFAFLLRQMPVCTQSPIKVALGPDRHRELRAKYKIKLGLDLLDDRCPNSFNCLIADSNCLGRPFPIDKEILEALKSINVEVTKGIFKGREVYLAQATVTCAGCPFAGQCETSCATQDSFLNRSTRPDSNPPESSTVPYDDYEKGMYGKALTPEDIADCGYGTWAGESLPLDCLTPKQRQVVEMTLYQGLGQAEIADIMGIKQHTVNKHKNLALGRLTEFGKARKYLELYGGPDRIKYYYTDNRTENDIALTEGVSQSAISQFITEWRKRHEI